MSYFLKLSTISLEDKAKRNKTVTETTVMLTSHSL